MPTLTSNFPKTTSDLKTKHVTFEVKGALFDPSRWVGGGSGGSPVNSQTQTRPCYLKQDTRVAWMVCFSNKSYLEKSQCFILEVRWWITVEYWWITEWICSDVRLWRLFTEKVCEQEACSYYNPKCFTEPVEHISTAKEPVLWTSGTQTNASVQFHFMQALGWSHWLTLWLVCARCPGVVFSSLVSFVHVLQVCTTTQIKTQTCI